ncbi:hypothetical protein TNCV_2227051 [Trichonephila clavipes]|uniref:Uncharacterized protein n=1 Tax=Trichonephila clavipes TaxID=2585209 RepID=A0A8X7BIW4_TRICX|nr:hypothetical protein TNCV_2227051 [Trichonephila clavipes]
MPDTELSQQIVNAVAGKLQHLLFADLSPAKVVIFIDSQTAILPLSSNTPTDCLNIIQCQTKIAGSQVMLGSPAMKEPTKNIN